jgi:dTDP-4-amino-4,6-dideoxygalactose transaminase
MRNFVRDPLPLFKAFAPGSVIGPAVAEVCDSGFLNEGVQVTELQRALSARMGTERLTLLNSCTAAIELALTLSNVDSDSSVISTPMTCVATNTPIVNAGAQIVWADIDPETGCIDPADVARIMRDHALLWPNHKKIRAVVCVDWAGNVCDLDALQASCERHGTRLIQDAAHAFSARWAAHDVSAVSDFTCFSFQAIKHFTTGDGGALVCRDPSDHARARRLKWFGLDRDSVKDSRGEWRGQQWDADIVEAGRKLNMNNIDAAIGLANLRSIDWILLRHRTNARAYDDAFAGSTAVRPLKLAGGARQSSSRWVYTIRVSREKRDDLLKQLNARGVKAGVVHVPNHDYSCFARFKRPLPGVEEFAATQLSLPCGWWMEPDDATAVARIVEEVLSC